MLVGFEQSARVLQSLEVSRVGADIQRMLPARAAA
jgi:hypothetical protein